MVGQRKILSVPLRKGNFTPGMNIHGAIQQILAIVKDFQPLPNIPMSLWSRNKQKQGQTGKRNTNIIWDTQFLQLGCGKTDRDVKKGQARLGRSPAEDQGHTFWDGKSQLGPTFGTVVQELLSAFLT